MAMQVIRSESFRSMLWKNGAGTTWEIALSPPDAGLDTFDWRISMATVQEAGPFSTFAGVGRSLAILEGDGMALDLPERRRVVLDVASQPLAFPGEWRVFCTPVNGALVDFNVMTRRNRFSHSLRRLALAGRQELPAFTTPFGLFVASEQGVTVSDEAGAKLRLNRNDLLMVESNNHRLTASCDGLASLLVFELVPHSFSINSNAG